MDDEGRHGLGTSQAFCQDLHDKHPWVVHLWEEHHHRHYDAGAASP